VIDVDELYPDHLRTLMRRTDAALNALEFDALVIHAGVPPVLFLDDQHYPFKVNPHFKSWVPVVDNPGCVLVYVPGLRPKLLFNRPDGFWHKPAPVPGGRWTEAVEIVIISDSKQAQQHCMGLGRTALIGSEAEDEAVANPKELLAWLHFDRAVKSPYELACMRVASKLAARGHCAAYRVFWNGGSEYAAHMAYLMACERREEEVPYNNIVAYDEHTAVLHYQRLERSQAAPARSFLIDAGAQFRGYAADITRTFARGAARFADLIAAVNEAQIRLCDEIVPGRDYREVHLSAHRLLGDVLHRHGIIHLPGQAALEEGITAVFFPTSIGHLLGLQVHDVGGLMDDQSGKELARPEGHPNLRMTRRLEPNVVVTVEPGIYMIESLLAKAHADQRRAHINWDVVAELKPFGGVRIEDNVAATTGRPENMTRDAFAKILFNLSET
jgi:Xaa-Pro dipeptidase